jgi:hypothetical protein
MKTRRLLWLYCVLACLGLAAWLVAVVAGSGELRAASADANKAVASATSATEEQGDKVALMEEEQRSKRADLSPQDAIRFSAVVQEEKGQFDALVAQRDAAQSSYATASQAYQRHMNKLIPIIALLILHIVGTMLFWPRRS